MSNGTGAAGLTLNQKVAVFPPGHLRKQVGDGECYALADRALRQAGARSADSYGKITADADYVWGTSVALKDVIAGDILQFRDHKITIKTVTRTKKRRRDGSVEERTYTEERFQERGHHTAIVAENLGGGALVVFEQHVKPLGPKVQRHTIHTESSRPRTEGGTTTTITVAGKIWAYRPQPR
jgi:hypothetical protein